jgi:hypothetical protein
MFIIDVTQKANASGAGILVAKGHGKQKTTRLDHALSDDANRGAAVGALLNLLTTPEQQAKVRHPSGGQRVRVESLSDGGGKHRFTIDV